MGSRGGPRRAWPAAQAAIGKAFKKVDEGIEGLNQIWDHVLSAATANQREKFEGELKDHTRKLQRDREQIKGWTGDTTIKEQTALVDARRQIEAAMERSTEFEREAKTKIYSKERLAAGQVYPDAETRAGLAEGADAETSDQHLEWLLASIDKINVQVDEAEVEMEVIITKKSTGKADTAKLEELKGAQETRRWHITTLVQVIRKLDNQGAEFSALDDLKDTLEMYHENPADPDSQDIFDGTHDVFNLE